MISKMMGFSLTAALLFSSSFAFSDHHKEAQRVESNQLQQFKTLLTAIEAAGLTEALGKSKPVTIFAPTEEAFASLPEGTLAALLKDKAKLRSVLKLHVVAAKMPASKVVGAKSLKSLLGSNLEIDSTNGVTVGGAKVVATDIECEIGIVHAIDRVLLPKKDIIDVAREAGSFKTLLAAVDAAGLTDALRGADPLTVFAPTDAAFAALPKGTVEALLKDKKQLTAILTYHVVSGKVPARKVLKAKTLKTLAGSTLTVKSHSCDVSGTTSVHINDAALVKADIQTRNGIIHVVDKVILPPAVSAN